MFEKWFYFFPEKELLELKNSPDIFNFLSNLPASIEDFDLLKVDAFQNINKNTVENCRKELACQVLTDGSVLPMKNGNRKIKRRSMGDPKKSSKGSIFSNIFGDVKGPDDGKNKNVRQTGEIWILDF